MFHAHLAVPQVKFDVSRWDSVAGWRPHFMHLQFGELCSALDLHGRELFTHLSKSIPGMSSKCPFHDVSSVAALPVAKELTQ